MSQVRRFAIGLRQDDALLLDKTGVSSLGWLRAGAAGLVLVGLLMGGSETAESEEDTVEEAIRLCLDHIINEEHTKALEWCRQAAEQGDADAQNNLGSMYYDGQGVNKDYAEAVRWYRKSAEQGTALEQGNAHSQVNLGLMYKNGYGVAQDDTEAAKWFRKGVEQGDARAQYSLAFMYWRGKGVPRNNAEAAKWFRKAAAQGHAGAKEILEEHF